MFFASIIRFKSRSSRLSAVICGGAFALCLTASAQQTAQPLPAAEPPSTSEAELRQQLVGKALYLRGGYLDNALHFDEHGRLVGHSPQGSYTLSAVEIDKVRLTKHTVELDGARYGLHFLGQLPYENPENAVDRVRITPKKKILKITIDREIVVIPKKKKGKPGQVQPAPVVASAEIPAEGVTTASQAHANRLLKDALDAIFAEGLDERMMAAMPDFWKLYYQAAAAKTDYRPTDPAVLRQNSVDSKAKLVSTFEPASNEYAQANAVAGMALYHTVIGADGKPGEIAVGRPIGFGLDENAVESIRKATFEPAIKDGKPVPVMLDLVVQFRIYSTRTAAVNKADKPDKPTDASLPGPYSLRQP